MGFTTTDSVFNNPITIRIMSLRSELESTPWYHFMERIFIKDELQELERKAFSIGIEIALKDLEEAGILKRITLSQ